MNRNAVTATALCVAWVATVATVVTQWGPFATPAAAEAPVAPPAVVGVAEQVVAAWLNAPGDDRSPLRPLLATDAPATGMRDGDFYVRSASGIDARPVGSDTWAVTVVADVLVLDGDGYRPDGARWFVVHVTGRAPRPLALGLPAEIDAPSVRHLDGTPDLSLPEPGPLTDAVAAFVRSRLAHHQARLRALDPGGQDPGGQDPGSGDRTVWAEVVATDRDGRSMVLHYPLHVTTSPDGVAINGIPGVGADGIPGLDG